MRVLVTGGAGFIGSHICDELLKNGHYVLVIDNLSTGFLDNIKHNMENENFSFEHVDINNKERCYIALKQHKIDAICHQAAMGSVPRSIQSPEKTHENNVNGFFNILDIARRLEIKRFVYASSSSVYGSNKDLPKVENVTGSPLSPYAASKYIDELYANAFTNAYNMECIGLRYFNIFGPRQNPDGPYAAVIPKFTNALKESKSPEIYGDGTYSRDFTYIANAVHANILALTTENEKCFGQAFNIGAGERYTINELFSEIVNNLEIDNMKPTYMEKRNGDVPHSMASIEKAKEFLNYSVQVDFHQGIKMLLKVV